MSRSIVSLSFVAPLALCVASFHGEDASAPQPTATPTPAAAAKLLGRMPVAFVPNVGQWEHDSRYVAQFGAMTLFLQDKGWTFTLVERGQGETESAPQMHAHSRAGRGVAVAMSFIGASVPVMASEQQLPGRHNYFLGNDPSRWRSDVPLFGSVCYRQLYVGVDVRIREQDGHLEYDLLLEPEAQLAPVEVGVEGIERMHLEADGTLVMETQLGPVRMSAPLTWEESPSGERSLVACRYVLRGEKRFGFEVKGRRTGWALTVDPGLVWSTFLGGGGAVTALAIDAQGAATVTGSTGFANFPTTPGAFATSFTGGGVVFVTRLSPSGAQLVYSTFLGGTSDDLARALVLDAQGVATVAGYTASADFPTTPGALNTSYAGGYDVFVTQLSRTGSQLVYSTFLGGTGDDFATALAFDAQGAATVAGNTGSSNFPTTPGAYATSYNGGYHDAFVARLSPTGSSLVYSTFLGGANVDNAFAIAIDALGAATVSGYTLSNNFPTTPGAYTTSFNGGGLVPRDAFVTRLSPTGSQLVYSTFLGGAGDDFATALALDAQGAATVAGATSSTNFPTTPGAFDTSHNGGYDVFVTRLSPTGAQLVYSTFLGGTGDDLARALVLDAQGAVTIAGYTGSTNFPTTPGAFDPSYNNQFDVFVTRLSPPGSGLFYSTFLGGSSNDIAYALALDAQGGATVAGNTGSTDFPTTPGGFDPTHNGGTDPIVSRLDMLPTGVAAFGRSSAGCTGPLAMSVTSMPRVGNVGFALTCGNAAPSTAGLLAYTGSGLSIPAIVLGVEVWVDPSMLLVPVSTSSTTIGACEVPLAIPSNPSLTGTRLFAQFFWLGPISPPPCPPLGLSASNALDFTIQS